MKVNKSLSKLMRIMKGVLYVLVLSFFFFIGTLNVYSSHKIYGYSYSSYGDYLINAGSRFISIVAGTEHKPRWIRSDSICGVGYYKDGNFELILDMILKDYFHESMPHIPLDKHHVKVLPTDRMITEEFNGDTKSVGCSIVISINYHSNNFARYNVDYSVLIKRDSNLDLVFDESTVVVKNIDYLGVKKY